MTQRLPAKPLLLFVSVFYLSVVARMIFSPLLLTIESDLGLDHSQAGSLFLFMSIGYAPMILLSGHVAAAVRHLGAILLALVVVAVALLVISLAPSLAVLRFGMFILGTGSGLYTASGVASLIRAVPSRHWGKAISIHEVAPNIASISAPIVALVALSLTGWRPLARIVALLCIAMAVTFFFADRSSRFYGAAPRFSTIKHYVTDRTFWVLALLFALSASAALGVYSILPTYLVAERGMDESTANLLISLARTAGLVSVFASGFLADRLGFRAIIAAAVGVTAVTTVLLGAVGRAALPVAVFAQPLFAAAFFPAALAALAHVGPRESQNVGVSLIIPFGIIAGGGAFPAVMGVLGESGQFYLGFIVLGAVMLASIVLIPVMRFAPADESDTIEP